MNAAPVIAIGAGEFVALAVSNPLHGLRRFSIDVSLPDRRPGEAVSFSMVTMNAAKIVPFLRQCVQTCDARIVEVGESEWVLQFSSRGGLHLVVELGRRADEEAVEVAGSFLKGIMTGREVHYSADPVGEQLGLAPC